MSFSRKLAGAVAVIVALTVAPAAGATPVTGKLPPLEKVDVPLHTVAKRAECWFWYYAAQEAILQRDLNQQFPDLEPEGPLPEYEHDPDEDRAEYNALWADWQEASRNYEELGCGELLGLPLPEWS